MSTATELAGGPRKRESGPRISRAATHKLRSTWFQAREAWPLRDAPAEALAEARQRAAVELSAAPGAAEWVPVGPANIGGRMTCAVSDPTDPDRLWAGAAGGGIWHSPDGGASWSPLWHDQATLNIGSLAIDPQEPKTIYCGTGEANLSADSHPGVGLFRSADGGLGWELVAGIDTGLPRRIGAVAVDPRDGAHLVLGGVSHRTGEPSGLYISSDGATTWTRVPLVDGRPYWCHDVRFVPGRPGVLLATISAKGTQNGIWRSRDDGASWEQLTDGLPSPDHIGRTSLATAGGDPDVLYAQVDDGEGAVLGIFRSANGGTSWADISQDHFTGERQMSYNNAIVVHAEEPDWVLCGGVDLHLTTDAGHTWRQVTRWDSDRGKPDYAHADHHALMMPAGRPGRVYDLNDGGVDISDDGGLTWRNASNGLATNMFYDLAVAQTDGRVIAGGAQDNGTLATVKGTADSYFELTGGDGGWVLIDPSDALHLFTTWQGMNMYRFRRTDRWKDVSPPEQEYGMWMVFTAIDPHHLTTVFTGSRRMWRTTDDGDTWEAVSGSLDDSDITALEVARADGRRIYVGTENGGIFRSTDGGDTWSGNLAPPSSPDAQSPDLKVGRTMLTWSTPPWPTSGTGTSSAPPTGDSRGWTSTVERCRTPRSTP
jgi:photosystem II stability/assembly factor-like uncharacterized protein